jgi:hypothetical protein
MGDRSKRGQHTQARQKIFLKMWIVPAIHPFGWLACVQTVDPHWRNGTFSLLTLTQTTIMSMQLQKQGSLQTTSRSSHHAAKLLHEKCTRINTNL